MKFINTEIKEVVVVEPKVFGDQRGYFFESFNLKAFEKNVAKVNFIQDNESMSSRGVVRGLHFQKPPFAQAKLVRCVKGKVLDVAVDIRKGSPTYGKSVSIILSEQNKKQLFIPRGFAHGFSVLSDTAIFSYKVDNDYAPAYESGILWNDKDLNIDWKLNTDEVILSSKDELLEALSNFETPFKY